MKKYISYLVLLCLLFNGFTAATQDSSRLGKDSTLSTVTIVSKKPAIENKPGKTIINVDAFIGSAGSNALEILERSPGVLVDNNDAISLKGKQGVLIYIDDRPSYLSGADLAAYLKSLPAGMLDRIEIMTTPPSKYDAAGNAGIINIKTKKSRQKGFNGNLSISYRQGVYGDMRNSFNFNYRHNKINLFANIGLQGGEQFNDLTIQRRYRDANGNLTSAFDQRTYIKRGYRSGNAKLGFDFTPNKRSTWGLVLNGLLRPSHEQRNNLGNFYNAFYAKDSMITADNYEEEKFKNFGINLNYRYQFDSLGKELSLDADHINYNLRSDHVFRNISLLPNNTIKSADDLTGNLPSVLNIYAFKADYAHPFKQGYKMEAGFKVSHIKTDNKAVYFTTVNHITLPDYDKTNHFTYDENISALYANLNKDFKKLSVQAGLRLEHTASKGYQAGNVQKPDSAFKRSYTNLFPTLFFSYKVDAKSNHLLNLSFSKRIDRPYYADLNPFISPLDKVTYYAGNPFLKPQFTQHVELAYVYKSKWNSSIFYDHVKDEMNETIELSGNTFISRTGNISKKKVMGFSIDGTQEIRKWFSILPSIQYVYIHTRSKVFTEQVDTRGGFWSLNLTNQFTFKKGWSAELLGRYRSKLLDGQFRLGATGQVNVSVQKKVFKEKGSFKINFVDILYTKINEGEINSLKGGEGYYHNPADTRAVIVAFAWRFSKGANTSNRNRAGSADVESGRVK